MEISDVTVKEMLLKLSSAVLKPKGLFGANFVITGGIGGCHHDNLQCHLWWQSWHHDDFQVSVF